jgi:hypothetical protein
LVVRQSAAELDVLRQVAARIGFQRAQQHAGQADRMGFRLQLLAVGHQHGRHLVAIAVVGDVIHRIGQEAAGATGGVIQGTDQAGIGLEQRIVRVEQ